MTTCDWCDREAVATIEIEPARMGFINVGGTKLKTTVKKAITARACARYAQVRDRTGGTVIRDPRKQKADVQQLDIYSAPGDQAA